MAAIASHGSVWGVMVSTNPMISRTLSYIGATVLTLVVAAAGCSKESKPTAEQPRAAGEKPAAEVTPAAVTAAGDKAGAEPAGGELGEASGSEADALKNARADYKETNFELS